MVIFPFPRVGNRIFVFPPLAKVGGGSFLLGKSDYLTNGDEAQINPTTIWIRFLKTHSSKQEYANTGFSITITDQRKKAQINPPPPSDLNRLLENILNHK